VTADPSTLEYLTAVGTVGAAAVAAVSVVVTGRQGREQQRLLLDAQERDVIERRADFELGLLLELSRLAQRMRHWGPVQPPEEQYTARGLLLALPADLLPTLRDYVSPLDDTLARERLHVWRAEDKSLDYVRLQQQVHRELRDAIFERRDAPAVSERLARMQWRWSWTFGR
jgi:hypothetical protein